MIFTINVKGGGMEEGDKVGFKFCYLMFKNLLKKRR